MASITAAAHRPLSVRSLPRAIAFAHVALAAGALASTLAQLAHGGFGPSHLGSSLDASDPRSAGLDLIGVALAAASALPLIVGRRHPFGVFVATATASVLLAALGYRLDLALGAAFALYMLTASRTPHTPWTRYTTGTVAGLFLAYLTAASLAQQAFPHVELVHSGLAWAAAWFAGERTLLQREHIAHLHERAHRTEREAERERLLAAAEERARIARDLHDSAGHAITVIAVRAGAARLRHDQNPDRTLPTLEAIEQLARQTSEEIDHIVGGLRRDEHATGIRTGPGTGAGEERPSLASPGRAIEEPPGLASLDTLIAHHAAAGLTVRSTASGTPRPLSRATDQATYRILQEALTNAARHGAGDAQIELAFHEDALGLKVTNPVAGRSAGVGRVAGPVDDGARLGGGHGLIGMRERATLLGGSLDVERTDHTFRLLARIPYESQPA